MRDHAPEDQQPSLLRLPDPQQPRPTRSGTGRPGVPGPSLHRRPAGPDPLAAPPTGQLPGGVAGRVGDRRLVLGHRIRPHGPGTPWPGRRPRAHQGPAAPRRWPDRTGGRGRVPRTTLRGGDLRVDRPGRPPYLHRYPHRTRPRTGRGAPVRRRRTDRPTRQALHRPAHPPGQAGRGRVVRPGHAGAVLGRVQGPHRAGLEHRQTTLRLRRRQDRPPGPGQGRRRPDQDPPRTRPSPRPGRGAHLRSARGRANRLRRHRRPPQHRPRPLPHPRADQPTPQPRHLVWLRRTRHPDQPQVHRVHGLEPPRHQIWRQGQPTRSLDMVRPTHPRTARIPRDVRSGRPSRLHPARLTQRTRPQHRPPAHAARVPAALLRPLWTVQPTDVWQDPPRPRLLLLLPREQQRRPPRPLPRRTPQSGLRPRRRPHRST